MIPVKIRDATHRFGAPVGWDQAAMGRCSHLFVRFEEGACKSAWEPTPAELALLNAGGVIVLSVAGGQPPVMLGVEAAAAGQEG